MAKTLISVDIKKKATQQAQPQHNRWHPDIPPVVSVKPGDDFIIEALDWTGGQIKNDDNAADIRDCYLPPCHHLVGPIEVKGAEPGDILVVDILDIGPLRGNEWGYTGIFKTANGGGFLTDLFPEPRKAIWDCKGIYASSRHIPKVRFAAITHPGLIGCAPSHKLLAEWNKREAALIATNPDRVPPFALPPEPEGVLLGTLKGADLKKAAKEAARTIPPREHGGNCDIKNISRGSRIYFPVYVKGAKLSMGDYHFSQGDGEITFCGAIEMAGWIHLHVDIIKGGVGKYGLTNPLFKISPVDPHYGDFLAFEGISVDDKSGKQLYNDATMAMRRACMNAIEYLSRFGYSKEQAYVILGCAPVEARIGGVVDIPNACVSVAIPTDMFEFDIHPNAAGPKKQVDSSKADLARAR
ncbi:MAG: acetamidase/formamidase family protein [Alphaproteobacteria bacterium]|nr:acetamidase/formamidase family protein [Alphaproteobacteria bacterium]